jgi:hypothetical protein
LTPEERRQIMGNCGDIYERYYMPNFIDRDTLAIYLGTTRRDDLILYERSASLNATMRRQIN